MTKKDEDFAAASTKKIRFRGDLNSYYFENHIEDIFDDSERKKSASTTTDEPNKKGKFHLTLQIENLTIKNKTGKIK